MKEALIVGSLGVPARTADGSGVLPWFLLGTLTAPVQTADRGMAYVTSFSRDGQKI